MIKRYKILQPLMFITFLMVTSISVQAMTLSEAKEQLATYKAQGKIGEKVNGFLAVIQDRKATRNLVKAINQERLKHYEKIALNNQLTLQEVEYLGGKKAAEKAKKGHYIQQNGQWVKK
ncbi:MAG: YdbL family protein [Thiomicrorhabdus sp.]|nr:YdbL family protein [Thiomicrorhabdus sp.]